MSKNVKVQLETMPRCVYSLPQFAAVGLTEEDANEKGIEYEKSIFPYAANGKALASDESGGFVKVLCEKSSGKLIGVHILGGHATELISSALTSINMNANIKDFTQMIFPHPTLSELIKESVLSVKKLAIHLPKN
jgi:dihydrolipoamide dehydrogenase